MLLRIIPSTLNNLQLNFRAKKAYSTPGIWNCFCGKWKLLTHSICWELQKCGHAATTSMNLVTQVLFSESIEFSTPWISSFVCKVDNVTNLNGNAVVWVLKYIWVNLCVHFLELKSDDSNMMHVFVFQNFHRVQSMILSKTF